MQITWWGFDVLPGLLWLPERPLGFVLLALYALALGYLLVRLVRVPSGASGPSALLESLPQLTRGQWSYVLLLALVAFWLANVVELVPPRDRLPIPPGLAFEPPAPAAPLFGTLPLVLAAGWLGPLPAALVGLASGLSRALWGSFQLTHILETVFFALGLSFCLRQDYRGPGARWMRRPLVASVLAGVPYIILRTVSLYAYTPQSSTPTAWLVTLDYMGSLMAAALPGMVLEIGVGGGLFGELAYWMLPALRPDREGTRTWPFQLDLNRQLLFAFVPTLILFAIGMLTVQMTLAVNVATNVAVNEMELAASDAAQSVPLFLTTGRSLLTTFADDERLRTAGPGQAQTLLDTYQRTGVYFQDLLLFDRQMKLLAAYPPVADPGHPLTLEELWAVGVMTRTSALQQTPVHRGFSASNALTFVAPVSDPDSGRVERILLGRVTLDGNPMMAGITTGMQNLLHSGEGFLVDAAGQIIAHPHATRVGQLWDVDLERAPRLRAAESGGAYQGLAPDGTRELFYVENVPGTDWSVVVSVPFQEVLVLAAELAQSALLLLVIGTVLAAVAIVFVARRVTRPLRRLAGAAGAIAGGDLESAVAVAGDDEVGQLGTAFEHMRQGLKARLDELGLLLEVTQSVAASLDLERGLPPVLNGALRATEATGARIALAVTDGRRPLSFAAGALGEEMEPLDAAVLNLVRAEGNLQIENVGRQRARLDPGPLAGRLQAVFALPLYTQERVDGVFWLSYTAPHHFSDTEIAFLTTLAGEAAVVLENARLFETAEGGRRRLSAILTSTTDPMIVTDRGDRLLLMNPAAEGTFAAESAQAAGRPVAEVLSNPALVELLAGRTATPTREVTVADGRIFYASASPIVAADGQVLGRVAVLRDITAIKALDEMKSEFVATVSHDLRGPLSLMRGYATMLSVVGELNPKQTEYAGKIVTSIGHMGHLIDELLDLGRIEAGVGLVREFCDIETLLGQVVEQLRAQAVAKGLTLHLEMSPVPPLSGDPTLLRQAVMNLVDNAVKYTPENGHVTVRAYCPDAGEGRAPAEVVIAVQDGGIGIAPADQVRLFEKFFRVKRRDTQSIKGSGLGLAIVKSIAERHGGRVWVESRLGEGSTFYIALPL